MIAAFLIIAFVLVWVLMRQKPKPVVKVSAMSKVAEPWAAPNEKLITEIRDNPSYDKHIWSKVAGVVHANDDGRSRQQAVRKCQPGELLELISEPKNKWDRKAIAVVRRDGRQVGYLNRELAEEIYDRMASGEHWLAIVTAVTGIAPHPHPWQGLNIALVRSKFTKNATSENVHRSTRTARSL